MNDSWDEYAADWDANLDVRAYSEKAFHHLSAIANFAGAEVFDFGCGTGLLTEKISPLVKTVVSLDPSPKMIAILAAKKLPNVHTRCGTLEELLSSEGSLFQSRFHLVVASSVCAFVPNYEEALRHIKLLLKPEGVFVQWDWLSSGGDSGPGFTEKQLYEALHNTGFHSVTVSAEFSMSSPEGDAPVLMAVAHK